MGNEQPGHLTVDELDEYFEGELGEEQEEKLEEHLAECSECTEQARKMYILTHALSQWTARAHGEAYARVALVEGMRQAEARVVTDATWRERIRRWRERRDAAAEEVVRVVMGAAGTASSVVSAGLEAIARPATGAVLTHAAVRTRGSVRRRGGDAEAPTSVAVTPGRLQASVQVREEGRLVVVTVDDLPEDDAPPLVLLVAIAEETDPVVKELESEPGAERLIARFEDLVPGDYLVAFEPLE